MPAKRRKISKNDKSFDLMFIFRRLKINVIVDDDSFSTDEINDIKNIIAIMSKEIAIDKSYVCYEGTKYEKFIISNEQSWNELCSLALRNYCDPNMSAIEKDTLQLSYNIMVVTYLYLILELFGYDSGGIHLEIKDKSVFSVEVKYDSIKEWKTYPGKWQTWD